jgi:hypothetical protein
MWWKSKSKSHNCKKDKSGLRRNAIISRNCGQPAWNRSGRRLVVESLEERRLLTLIGVSIPVTVPQIFFDSAAQTVYAYTPSVSNPSVGTGVFKIVGANALYFYPDAASNGDQITPFQNAPLSLSIQLDQNGNLVSGSGTSTDLVVDGQVTTSDATPVATYTDPLLTGEIQEFGYAAETDSMGIITSSDAAATFDFVFKVTGGSLATTGAEYFPVGTQIGMIDECQAESPVFTNVFNTNFGGNAEGYIGPYSPIINQTTPTITTTPNATSVTLGTTPPTLTDTAVITNGNNPTGTVTFTLYDGSTLVDTETGSLTYSSGTYSATTPTGYTLPTTDTVTGTYQWDATYNGDTNNASVSENGNSAEQVTITPAAPAINTSQQPATAIVGSSIADTATVTGGYSPTGTVTFNLYNNSAGTGTPLATDANVPLVSGVATSPGYKATATGTDYWVATYNSDSNNVSVSSGTALEPVVITPATPAINTSQQPATAIVGSSIADTATVTGGYSPTGTVTFNLYSNSSGTGTLVTDANVALVNGVATSPGYTATATGTDYWVATYNGDSNNVSVSSGTALESVVITPATPAINTSQQPATAIVGSSIADTATVTGGYSPTGTVTFNLYSNSSGTGTLVTDANVPLVNGVATSPGYTATATGTDYWVATYNGDSNNSPVSSGTASEPVTITPATPAINTSQTPVSATVGTSIADAATVTGGYSPTGTVTFNLYSNSSGTGTLATDANMPLVSGVATSPGYTATATGTDYWVATYNGNSNNVSVSSGTASEPVTITPATPAINTSQQPATAIVGSSIADTATVTGGYSPTGTVTFNLYNNSAGTGTPLATDANVPLVSGVATSPGYTATATGTDYWVATYNSDSNNFSVSSGTALEPVTITPATPSINTTAGPTVVLGSGNPLTDSALLSGGYNPTGTITFALYQPSDTSYSSAVYTKSITASEDGSYGGATLVSYMPLVSGTYEWLVTYTDTVDGNNLTANSGKGNEPECVTYTNVTVTKTTNTPNISAGQTAEFTVTITNTGTATATGVSLSDPLPAGLGKDVSWTIVSNAGNPSDFTITGSTPSQSLGLSTYFINTLGDSLAPGQSISVQITGVTNADDVSSGCTTQCVIPCNFNSSAIPGGDYIWFTCAVDPQGLSSTQSTTISCTGQTISFTCGGHNYSVPVPNGCLTYAPNCSTATTSCSTGSWVSYDPDSGLSGNEFLCGVAFQVPAGGLAGGIKNVTWTGNDSSNAACNINCEWAAAVYSSAFTSACSSLNVKPCDNSQASQYKNSDNCGTPENYKNCVTVGACGNGGSNYTGSYCTPCPVTPPTMSCGTGTLPNTATVSAKNQSSVQSSATVTIGYATAVVSGTKFNDLTGNGFSSDDTGQSGVTIDLYRATSSGGETLVTSATTASNGSFSFSNLVPGDTYYVQEVVPSGYIQTGGGPSGTAGSTYYTICATNGGNFTGNNFDDYLIPTCSPTFVSYYVNGGSTALSSLGGQTVQGDTVTVKFTVTMTEQLTLVSYIAPGSSWNASLAYEQQIFDEASGTFTGTTAAPKTYTLTILVPNCYYQVDFACGPAINVLVPQTYDGCPYGPDSANIWYHGENRYVSSDNGGTQAYAANTVAKGEFGTTAFWTTSTTGQKLIDDFNGSSSSTQAAQWLATNFPNLYGPAAATGHSLVTSGGAYFTNTQLASAYAGFTGGDEQVLSAALSVYATSTNLAGSVETTLAVKYGLTVSAAGSDMDTYSVGAYGSSFGVANNTTLTVMQLLGDLNANTAAKSDVSSGGGSVFSGINTIGNV